MKVVLEFDDFSPVKHEFSLLETLREHYPKIKFSMFTVPWEVRFGDQAPITDTKALPWVKGVQNATDWIEIELHGLNHTPLEFAMLGKDEAWKRITIAEKMFQNRKVTLQKIFKAPYWMLSDEARQTAESMGYTVIDDHYYNWNLKDLCPFTDEQIIKDAGYIVAHGHITNDGCDNAIGDVFPKLMRLPPETEFIFLSQYLKEKNTNG